MAPHRRRIRRSRRPTTRTDAAAAAVAGRDHPHGGSARLAALARGGRCKACLGACRAHAMEGDLLALRYRTRDSEPALAIRALPDRVAAQWAEGSGQAVARLCR